MLRGITEINFHREAIAALEKRKRAAAGTAVARNIRAGMEALLAVAQFADDETSEEVIPNDQENSRKTSARGFNTGIVGGSFGAPTAVLDPMKRFSGMVAVASAFDVPCWHCRSRQ